MLLLVLKANPNSTFATICAVLVAPHQGSIEAIAMAFWIATPLVALFLTTASVRCPGQELEEFPDAALTREQWQQRVEAARRRSEDFVANTRAQIADPSPSDQLETEAAERAANDPTLRQGDIISTRRGLFVFTGRDEEHRPGDFLPDPSRRSPP
jgi:hypothetical protein